MKTTLTLTQGNAYTHTIAVEVNESVTLTFGQLLGHLTHKFFRSTMAMRHSNNKGFSFNNPFDFIIECNGHKVSTLELDETLRAKVRMSNTKDGIGMQIKKYLKLVYPRINELQIGMYPWYTRYQIHHQTIHLRNHLRMQRITSHTLIV